MLCRVISAYLSENEKISWSVSVWRICCTGHFINLFVQAFFITDTDEFNFIQLYEDGEAKGFEELSGREKKEYEIKFQAFRVLRKLHNIVVHIQSSPGRMK